MDHAAYLASVELAPDKVRPAALFKKRSQAVEDAINGGRVAAVAAQGFTEMQGGLPIVVDGKVSADGTAWANIAALVPGRP
jgi:glc operon protein GlcG